MNNLSNTQQLTPLQKSFLIIERLQSQLDALKKSQNEPIVIVGMGCRFPGGASTPEAFWDLLQNGVDAITEVPPDRWPVNKYYDSDPTAPGKISTRYGGFVEGIEGFDTNFFGISPKETIHLDPQQRLLLEVSWEALERSAINPQKLKGSSTGVFIGICSNDYTQKILSQGYKQIDGYLGTGNSHSTASGRLSYLLGLKGPSLAVDTACSSSLVGIHLATTSLRDRECDLALAGGVNALVSPEFSINFSKAGMLSPDGRCKTFDAKADGYVRSEGCGIVVLKRLSDALAHGDNILAVIRGTAINQDGDTSGLTVPNGPSQQAVIRKALENAGVELGSVSYIEAHGTGTSLGDPIEVGAVGEVFKKTHSQEKPVIMGSVKTNIGHLEGAAGIASLIKVVLQLQHQQIVPSLHFNQPNPYINWDQLPVQVSTEMMSWPGNGLTRVAGVSSFGFSGTNAHVVLEETPSEVKSQKSKVKNRDNLERSLHLLTLSAKTETALEDLVSNYQNYLKIYPEIELADICYTANIGRAHFNHRLAVIASDRQELLEKFLHYKRGEEVGGIYSGELPKNITTPKIAFLFTGQGSQYVNMGRQLYQHSSVFQKAIDRCDEILGTFHQTSLKEVIYPINEDESNLSRLSQTVYTQPALFAIEYALAQLWLSWGIKPDIVMGHSVGEYVAATIAGIFSLEDGLKLIAERGRLMQELPHGGEMVAVMASESKVKTLIATYPEISIAAINGPESIVISGDSVAMKTIVSNLNAEGIKTKQLEVSHAFHSPLMEPMLTEFAAVASGLTYSQPQITIISNVTGTIADDSIASGQYWVNHVRQPVRFAQGMETLQEQGAEIFLEIGPKPILLGMGRQCLSEVEGVWLPSLRPGKIPLPSPLEIPLPSPLERGKLEDASLFKDGKLEDASLFKDGKLEDASLLNGEWQQMLSSLGQLYVKGTKVDWSGFDCDYARQKVALPTYPFQRQRHWVETSKIEQQASSEILTLLAEGKTQDLLQQLHKSTSLEELNLEQGIDLLAQLHQRQTAQTSIRQLLYQEKWFEQSTRSSKQLPPGQWLLLADQSNLASALARYLEAQKHECHFVDSQANLDSREILQATLNQLTENSTLPFHGIIYMWSWEQPTDEANNWQHSIYPLLNLVQAIGKLDTIQPKLWIITRSAIAINSNQIAVNQTPLWGLGRVIALEYPQLWGGLIDIEENPEPILTAQKIYTELSTTEVSVQVAYRQEKRYQPQLVPYKETPPILKLNSESSYVISGGLGSVGLKVAQRWVEQGARHLVLLGRRGVTNQTQQQIIAELEAKGTQIEIVKVDISNWTELQQAWTEWEKTMPPVRGIVHAAGVVDDGLLENQNRESFVKVMSPKVEGGWNLHQLTQDPEIDFFICFSSAAAMLGSPGQGNYAAANAFLDGLCTYRRSLGLPGLSLNWGPWSEAGMAANLSSAQKSRLATTGLKLIEPEQGLQILEQLLGAGGELGVLAFDWEVLSQRLSSTEQNFFAQVIPEELKASWGATAEKSSKLQQKLLALGEAERKEFLRQILQEEVAHVLGLPIGSKPEPEVGFFDMGMDSLMAVELKNRLSKLLGVNLQSTLTFDFPNIERVSHYINSEVLQLESMNETDSYQSPKIGKWNEPIAIIGMSCRFPGGANNPEQFWELLQTGTSAIQEIPEQRWNIEEYYDPNPEVSGKIITRYGHFIADVDKFDPSFFGISYREAAAIDPQHRILLEVSWEALEQAGQVKERLDEASVGVFIGNDGHDYEQLLQEHLQQSPESSLANYIGTGTHISSAAGRIAYTFGFTGPTVTIDTACSSSLVAVHQASNSLRLGECKMALAGGVKLHLTPNSYIGTSNAKMISADGKCKTFDSTADGYGRGEGCGMVLLKPLSEAQKDGDPILAVIRGSGVNQDGASSGLTVPNGRSQQRLIKQVLAQAEVEASEISYLEAHGTGTSLGDPIEVNAAVEVLGKNRSDEQPLWLSSVKTNIGHLEAAAGISGLIKVVLSLQHQQLSPHLHLESPNPKIDWQPWLKVPQLLTPWQVSSRRLAGVSSFGFTGTNAHVLLEEAPSEVRSQKSEVRSDRYEVRSENYLERPLHLLTLSAKTEIALKELINRYENYLATHVGTFHGTSLPDICFTANTGRLSYSHRLSLVVETKEELQELLKAYSAGQDVTRVMTGIVKGSEKAKLAMLFTGQGSQYQGMGQELYQTQPQFRNALDRCAEILAPYLDKSLWEILYSSEIQGSVLDQTAYTQPAIFAVEYALYQLWLSWGIKPDLLMGHSVGEYVAATIAGIWSLEDGLKLIAERGRLMQELPHGGEMVAVMASESRVKTLIAPYPEISIAAINGPQSIVISGDSVAMKTIVSNFKAEGIKTQQLQVSHAFHSPLMEPMLAEFAAVASAVTYNQPQIKIISNVTGTIAYKSMASGQYWVNHVCQPVKFAQGMETLQEQGAEIFLEIGPKPILLGMGRQCLSEVEAVWLPSLRPGVNEWQQMLSSLGQLYVKGAKVDWTGFDCDYARQKVALPTYPFQRQRYWVKTAVLNSSDRGKGPMFSGKDQTNIQNLINYLKTTGDFSDSELQLFDKMQVVLENNSINQVEDLEENKTDSEFIHVLEKASQRERRHLLINHLQNQIAAVVEWPHSQLPDPEMGFFEMGYGFANGYRVKEKTGKNTVNFCV